MTNAEILNGIEALLNSDPTLAFEKTADSITIRKNVRKYTEIGIYSAYFERGTLAYPYDLYEHRITLLGNGQYAAEDKFCLIKGKSYAKGNISMNFDRGNGDTWSTESIQKPIENFLVGMGLEKKMPFWTGKRIAIGFAVIWIPIIIAAIVILIQI